jgi:sarcosine oxidase subunit gamma
MPTVSGFVVEAARRSALDGLPERLAPPDLVVTERPGLTLVHFAANPSCAGALRSASSALGVALLLEPNTTASSSELTIFWMGAGRWLIESERLAANEIEDRLRAASDAGGVAIADLSSGRTVIRVCGEAARRTLAQGCPIDLHPRAFPPGSIAHSMLEGISVMLHHLPDGNAFDLYVPRSYSLATWEWLTEAAGAGRKPG